MIKMAAASGKYEEALKAQQWLIDHAVDEDGARIVGPSVDKQGHEERNTGPNIQIFGFQFGDAVKTKALPEPVIDIEVDASDLH